MIVLTLKSLQNCIDWCHWFLPRFIGYSVSRTSISVFFLLCDSMFVHSHCYSWSSNQLTFLSLADLEALQGLSFLLDNGNSVLSLNILTFAKFLHLFISIELSQKLLEMGILRYILEMRKQAERWNDLLQSPIAGAAYPRFQTASFFWSNALAFLLNVNGTPSLS